MTHRLTRSERRHFFNLVAREGPHAGSVDDVLHGNVSRVLRRLMTNPRQLERTDMCSQSDVLTDILNTATLPTITHHVCLVVARTLARLDQSDVRHAMHDTQVVTDHSTLTRRCEPAHVALPQNTLVPLLKDAAEFKINRIRRLSVERIDKTPNIHHGCSDAVFRLNCLDVARQMIQLCKGDI